MMRPSNFCHKIFLFFILSFLFALPSVVAADVEMAQGSFLVRLLEDSGAFSVAYKDSNNKTTDFFVSHDEFSSTFFSLKVGNTVYKLGRGSSVKFSTYRNENSGGIKYQIGDELDVYVDFSFCPGFDGATLGAVKVEVSVHNLSSEVKAVALKGVFDTYLGENSGNHFVTAMKPYVGTELGLRNMDDDKWIRSSNGKYSLQFLLSGAGITKPQSVLLANKDILGGATWFPAARDGRSFNSVFSYNNSAVGLLWNSMTISPVTKSSVCFYLTYSVAGATPADATFLGTDISGSSLNEKDEVVYRDEFGATYTVGALTNAQLDPKYIEDLLNRIRRLEAEPEKVDRNEILQLNAELDAILEKIRRL